MCKIRKIRTFSPIKMGSVNEIMNDLMKQLQMNSIRRPNDVNSSVCECAICYVRLFLLSKFISFSDSGTSKLSFGRVRLGRFSFMGINGFPFRNLILIFAHTGIKKT